MNTASLTGCREQNVVFTCGNASAPVLVLDKDGMIYKGQRIEDAGEAHRAFLEVMAMMKEQPK